MFDKYLTADIVDNELQVDMPEFIAIGAGDGEDGFSPIVSLEKVGKVSTLEITDKNGVHKTEILDGADGYIPIKGTDYFTDADKAEMVEAVLAALPSAEGVGF